MASAFDGIGSLPAYVAKAKEAGGWGLTLSMADITAIEDRITGLAALIDQHLTESQDARYAHEMALAESAAQTINQGGWV